MSTNSEVYTCHAILYDTIQQHPNVLVYSGITFTSAVGAGVGGTLCHRPTRIILTWRCAAWPQMAHRWYMEGAYIRTLIHVLSLVLHNQLILVTFLVSDSSVLNQPLSIHTQWAVFLLCYLINSTCLCSLAGAIYPAMHYQTIEWILANTQVSVLSRSSTK